MTNLNQPNPPPDEQELGELTEWLANPLTKRFFLDHLHNLIESAKADWAKGAFEGASLDEWAVKNATSLGAVIALKKLRTLETKDILDAEKEARERNQQVRN